MNTQLSLIGRWYYFQFIVSICATCQHWNLFAVLSMWSEKCPNWSSNTPQFHCLPYEER